MKNVKKIIAATALATACAVGLSACSIPFLSKASDTTCEEYGKQDYDDRSSTIMRMIEEHGFDSTSSVWGTISIGAKVETFCGAAVGSDATQNLNSKIEDAIDWSTVGKD